MTMVTVEQSAHLLGEVARLAPAIRVHRDKAEQLRRLPEPLVHAMVDAGLFGMWLPEAYGGLECDPMTFVRVIEAVSRVDGSTGWTLMIGAAGGAFAAYLPARWAGEIFSDPRMILAGSFTPNGRAVPVEGGYRLSGRWSWGSGIHNAGWIGGNSLILDGDQPRMGENGAPAVAFLFFPATACTILDTWYSGGLRATGSTDFAVEDIFVPEDCGFALFQDSGRLPGPLYRAPITTLLPACVAAVPLGIARAAIDELIDLAGRKTPLAERSLLRDRPQVQVQVARSESTLSAARAFLFESLENVWKSRIAGEAPSAELTMCLRLACIHAGESALQVVETMYKAGGGSSAYSSSPLDRCMRDVHVATQHIGVSPNHYDQIGRELLGIAPA